MYSNLLIFYNWKYLFVLFSNFDWICDQKLKKSTTVQNFVHKKKAGMDPLDRGYFYTRLNILHKSFAQGMSLCVILWRHPKTITSNAFLSLCNGGDKECLWNESCQMLYVSKHYDTSKSRNLNLNLDKLEVHESSTKKRSLVIDVMDFIVSPKWH
jgi:hypothetical protein